MSYESTNGNHKFKNHGHKLKNKLRKRVVYILGESIFEHDLVRGSPETQASIKTCNNMRDVVKILQRRYNEISKKNIILPGGRDLYSRFKNELHPDFKPV